MPETNDHHVYHHYDVSGTRVNLKLIRNTKGYNWEITVTEAASVDEGLARLREADQKLRAEFGEPAG